MELVNRKERSQIIDLIKGIGVLMIIVVHTAQKYKLPVLLTEICAFGQYGCQLFLLLSGFLAYRSLENSSTRAFYGRRLRSIIPGWWITIWLFAIFNAVWHGIGLSVQYRWNGSPLGIISNMLLLNGLIPAYNNSVVPGGWYIGTLVLLYALSPILKKAVDERKTIVLIVSLLAVNILFQHGIGWLTGSMELSGNNKFFYFLVLNQSTPYILGMLLAFKQKTGGGISRKKLALLIASIALLLIVLFVQSIDMPIVHMLTPVLTGLAFYVILRISLIHENEPKKRNPQRVYRWLTQLGKCSLGAYLLHTIFAFSMTWAINKLLARVGVTNNVMVFLPVLILVIILVYWSGRMFQTVIQWVTEKIYDRVFPNGRSKA